MISSSINDDRSANAVAQRWHYMGNPSAKNGKWDDEEDSILLDLKSKGKDWQEIADAIPGRSSVSARRRWKTALNPDVTRGHWTPEEDEKIVRLHTKYNGDWPKIVQELPGRITYTTKKRWDAILDPSIKKGRWEPEEDAILIEKQKVYGNRWSNIAKHIPGRTQQSVMVRWVNSLNPDLNKGPYDPEEDAKLLELHKKYGEKWSRIAQLMNNRSISSIKSRYTKLSDHNQNIKKGKWTRFEDNLLLELHEQYGSDWKTISKHIPERPISSIKARWNIRLNPKFKKGRWTEDEDKKLLELKEKHGDNWKMIAKEMTSRSSVVIKKRWTYHLDPTLKKGKWSKEEDILLRKLVKKHDFNWKLISREIPGRPTSSIKYRWSTHLDPIARKVKLKMKSERDKWEKYEDSSLVWLHNKYNGKWSRIAQEMPGRTQREVRTRFLRLKARKEKAGSTSSDSSSPSPSPRKNEIKAESIPNKRKNLIKIKEEPLFEKRRRLE